MDTGSIFVIVFGVLLIGLRLFIRGLFRREMLKDKTFACPHCGHRFQVKRFYFNALPLYTYGSAKLKCPNCGIKDICRYF